MKYYRLDWSDKQSETVSGSWCVCGNLEHLITLLRLTSPADGHPIQTTHTTVSTPPPPAGPPAASVYTKQNREETCSRDGWRDWRRTGGGEGGPLGAYAHSDTFSLFLFSRPVLIISILGRWGPPNIELVLIDQPRINKPRQGWQHVSRGRGQIGCTDYLHYQGQASLGASGCLCVCVCVCVCVYVYVFFYCNTGPTVLPKMSN